MQPELMVLSNRLSAHAPFEPNAEHIIKAIVVNLKAFQRFPLIRFVTFLQAIWRPQRLLLHLDWQVL